MKLPVLWSSQLGDVNLNNFLNLNAVAAVALNTVGAATISAAGIVGGLTLRGGTQTAVFTDTTDTAANIVAALAPVKPALGYSWVYRYVNNGVFAATLAAGTGVTVTGATVVPANSWIEYLVTVTGASALSMQAIGQAYFPKSGSFVANGATPVTVADARITANSNVLITLKTVGGTVGAIPAIQTITAGTGFTVAGTALDTSTYVYEIRG